MTYVGLDVSKDHLDVAWQEGDRYAEHRHSNDESGFAQLLALLPQRSHVVLEATGPYYLGLALYLHEHGQAQSVVNPLVVKRFAQMHLRRAKTDQVDARLLAQFGAQVAPPLWQAPAEHIVHLQQLQATLSHYIGERTRISNQREAFAHSGRMNAAVGASLKRMHRQVEKEIKRLEDEIDGLTRSHHGDLFDRLRSIPGIGPRSALLLIVASEGFTRFTHVKQLVAYVGLAPRLSSSGRRRAGRSSICKMGTGRLRASLYMAARSAIRCNPACQSLYERLRQGGKGHRVALVAVAHKLVRQAFAVGTQGTCYELDKSLSKPAKVLAN